MSLQQSEWNEVERNVARLLHANDGVAALKELNGFLAKTPPLNETRSALQLRSMVKEEADDYVGALEDASRAHSLSEPGTYTRYTLELGLSSLSAICGDLKGSDSWLRAALNTARVGEGISGGSALRKFLELRRDGTLDPAEHTLCLEVARRSWVVLRQPGEPDASDLPRLAKLLVQLGSKPLPHSED